MTKRHQTKTQEVIQHIRGVSVKRQQVTAYGILFTFSLSLAYGAHRARSYVQQD